MHQEVSRKSEGTEANNFNAVYGSPPGLRFFRESAATPEITGGYKPLVDVFALESSPIDRCVALNCGTRVSQRGMMRPGG